jgi:hypothetical protein
MWRMKNLTRFGRHVMFDMGSEGCLLFGTEIPCSERMKRDRFTGFFNRIMARKNRNVAILLLANYLNKSHYVIVCVDQDQITQESLLIILQVK